MPCCDEREIVPRGSLQVEQLKSVDFKSLGLSQLLQNRKISSQPTSQFMDKAPTSSLTDSLCYIPMQPKQSSYAIPFHASNTNIASTTLPQATSNPS
jgi:hypothetical protein